MQHWPYAVAIYVVLVTTWAAFEVGEMRTSIKTRKGRAGFVLLAPLWWPFYFAIIVVAAAVLGWLLEAILD